MRTSRWFIALLVSLSLIAPACGDDDDDPAVAADAPEGVVAVRLEAMTGRFIEGFEIGLRFETADGEVLGSTLWTDSVTSAGTTDDLDAWYEHVHEQEVPAGTVVVLATPTIGPGGPPPTPDLEGELDCRLEVTVPDGGRVEVEVGFDASTGDCLRLAP